MLKHRYQVGDKVLVSRAETGEDHELGEVVDSYELLIGSDERRPIVVVEFENGERQYLTAATPNVLPFEPEEDEPGPVPDGDETNAPADDVLAADSETPPDKPDLD